MALCLPVVGKKTDLTKSGGSPPFLQPCSSPFYFTLKARSFESKPCVLLRCTYSQLSFPWSLDRMAFSLIKTWFIKRKKMIKFKRLPTNIGTIAWNTHDDLKIWKLRTIKFYKCNFESQLIHLLFFYLDYNFEFFLWFNRIKLF